MKIAFFDSGVGGITIFKEALKDIKAEYFYFADNLNTPYGTKSKEIVKKYVIENINKIMKLDPDIVVVACNTATSVAIEELRNIYSSKCIIGLEPAIKVSADKNIVDKKILVSATTLTIKEEKIKKLIDKLDIRDKVDFVSVDKLVEFAEDLDFESDEVCGYINEKLSEFNLENYSDLVLGCTHFPLFKEVFKKVLPNSIDVIDSSQGVINNIKNKISILDLKENNENNVTLILSEKDEYFIDKFAKISGIDTFEVKIV